MRCLGFCRGVFDFSSEGLCSSPGDLRSSRLIFRPWQTFPSHRLTFSFCRLTFPAQPLLPSILSSRFFPPLAGFFLPQADFSGVALASLHPPLPIFSAPDGLFPPTGSLFRRSPYFLSLSLRVRHRFRYRFRYTCRSQAPRSLRSDQKQDKKCPFQQTGHLRTPVCRKEASLPIITIHIAII